MNPYGYVLLALVTLTPSLATAQQTTTDVILEIGGSEYDALGAAWDNTVPWIVGMPIGPSEIVVVESRAGNPDDPFPDAPPDEGCNPYTAESAAAVNGKIALVERGVCAFILKTQNASAAGAIAVLVYGRGDEETLVSMGGDPCGPAEGCTAPAAFILRTTGLAVLAQIKLGEEGTLIPQAPPPPPASVVIDNGTLLTSLFADGFIGHDPSFVFGEGFTFDGEDGLFVGSVLIGVNGDVNANPYDGESEFTALEDPRLLDPAEIRSPFDVGAQAVFTSPLGFTVTLTGYADADAPNEDFVIYYVDVLNTSGADINDVYIGLFADFDAGASSGDDAAGYDAATSMAFVFDPVEASPYFGVVAVCGLNFSGYSTDATRADDAQLFEALASEIEPSTDPMERAAVVGTGPYDIAAGETQTTQFAFVAGADLADLFANASCNIEPATEQTTAAGTYMLESAYPNPFATRTTLSFTLPRAQAVRLAVYDVLGREVAVLVDGARPAGEQTVAFDAAGLPSGVYLYRLEAGGTVLTQQFTLVR